MSDAVFLADFHALAPAYLLAQGQTLEWLCEAHTRAQSAHALLNGEQFDERTFGRDMNRALNRYGCNANKIATRGIELADCAHHKWDEMAVYQFDESPTGRSMDTRVECYSALALNGIQRLYTDSEVPPADLLHVTCTGYRSPSAAQLLVSKKGWGFETRVTHLYQMGCYASLPALHVASGLVFKPKSATGDRVDVVHTELCSLHMNPILHAPEQLVVQTLFSDGIVRYSLTQNTKQCHKKAFRLCALLERIIPDSADCMKWVPSHWGMLMTLARDVPERVSQYLSNFVTELCRRASLTTNERDAACFAVHPGGPKILDFVAQRLHLGPDQLMQSRKILATRGNMSSATLPHIWSDILEDANVADGQVIVSLAFGPGLTVSGAVMRKESS